jgi:hypothetical protein
VAEKKAKTKAKAPPKKAKAKARPTRTKAAVAAANGPANSYLYSEALADKICAGLAKGLGLKPACRRAGVDASTAMRWATDMSHPFAERYKKARTIGFMLMAEEIIEIADNSEGDLTIDQSGNKVTNHENIQRSRLKVEARKWIVSRMLPHIFGDRVVAEHTGPNGGAIQIDTTSKMAIFFEKIDAIARRQAEMKALEAEAEAEAEKERR